MPFVREIPIKALPLGFAYCAILSVASVGLVRLGRQLFLSLVIPLIVALIPGYIGMRLIHQPDAALEDSGVAWFRVSLYLFCAVGMWGIYLVVKGWLLYFRKPN